MHSSADRLLPEGLKGPVGWPNSTIVLLFLLALLAGTISVSAQGNETVVIETHSIIPTKPVWFDDTTVLYKTCSVLRVSPAQYAPNPISLKKYDLASGEQVQVAKGEYGSLSQDRQLILSIERRTSQGIDQGMRYVVTSQIKLIDAASKAVITDYTCPEVVHGASLSPDNRFIIFATQGNLWRSRVGESGAEIVLLSKEKKQFPRHSSDGNKLYFVGDTYGGTDFYALDFASNAVVQISRGLNPISSFSLSPDDKSITYASINGLQPQSQYSGNIWVLNLATGKTRQLTEGGDDQHPSYSPNGQRIVFQRQQGFYPDSDLKTFQVIVVSSKLTVQ